MGLFNKKKTEDKAIKITQKKIEKNKSESIGKESFSSLPNLGIVISSIVTEKSHNMNQEGKYLFKISSKTNKDNVKRAIEEIYKVNVEKVNVLTVSNKKRTIKYNRGNQKTYKKAIVTLRDGQSITVFEGI